MKRRLSLAISAIGNPKIILLDEPTTGLDPKVRQQVWQLIEKLKVAKSIILTTHSM
jgi:ABC-type multidrug transport system ATPase subunit